MKIYLIRHGMTEGNKKRAYIGAGIDETLCEEGIEQLQAKSYPRADVIFVSPMKRCIMTAEQIYPKQEIIVCEELREMSFGDFEGKSYEELKDNSDYIRWLESGGESAFPNGETKKDFVFRSQSAFRACMSSVQQRSRDIGAVAFVVHGGTIMAIMEEYGKPKGEYYRWQLKTGEFIKLDVKFDEFNQFSKN